MSEWRICRGCGVNSRELVKYGVRHYACTPCLFNLIGLPRILELPTAELGRVAPMLTNESARDLLIAEYRKRTEETSRPACLHTSTRRRDGVTHCNECGYEEYTR